MTPTQSPSGTIDLTKKIKIKGGEYRATDTGDGYFTVHDVPIMSEVPKGTKGAPEDIDRGWLEDAVRIALERYDKGHFAGTAYVHHNAEIELNRPNFVGYVLPKRVGDYPMEEGVKATIFADIKMKSAAFELALKGELPYHSPEVPWKKERVAGLAFLQTKPPHFEYALFTIGEIKQDHTARFQAQSEGKSMPEDKKNEKKDNGKMKGQSGEKDDVKDRLAKMEAQFAKFAKYMEDNEKEKKDKEAKMQADESHKKPNALPLESSKMEADPAMAAKFAAQADEMASLKKRLDERDRVETAAKLTERAMGDLRGYIIGNNTKAQIAKFALEGEEKLGEFVATVKEVAQKEPPTKIEDFMGAPEITSDPAVAKFEAKGPEALSKASRFAAEYNSIKSSPAGKFMRSTKDQYIDAQFQMIEAQNEEAM